MAKIPEGAKTASGEGQDVKAAVDAGAEALGIEPGRAGWTLDMEHFRNAAGGSVARQTVKVVVWEKSEEELAAAPAPEKKPRKAAPKDDAPRQERSRDDGAPRRERSRDDDGPKGRGRGRGRRDDDRSDEGALEVTEAAKVAQAWFEELIGLMGLTGTIEAKGNDTRVVLDVDVDKAGRLIGRRGSTLAAVRHLLKLALDEHGDFIIDVEIPDARDSKPASESKGKDGGRGRRGGRRRDEDDRPRSEYPEDKLQAVGRRAAEKAVSSGKPVTINLLLNSYDRRIVHMASQEVDGVESQSVVKDGKKYVQVVPTGA